MKCNTRILVTLALAALPLACSGGGSGDSSEGGFRLIEFLEAGQDNIPRNRQLQFRFSAPVMEQQDLSARLRIQNVVQDGAAPNFALARGSFVVNGDEVAFTPRLPQLNDRSDAGFKANGTYHVFLSGGPNGLASVSGDRVPSQQEFIFETNQYFEDIRPGDPPRAVSFVAVDPTNGSTTDIARLDPRPFELSLLDNATLRASNRIIDPGAGPGYTTPWHLELRLSEPIDPSTLDNRSVEMFEIYSNALTAAPDQVDPGHFGDFENFRVATRVETYQSVNDAGEYDVRVRVIPLQILTDNTRYRIRFAGDILGLDFRKTFAGDNGLTGDGQQIVDGSVFAEPGGLGYVSEFLVYDRPAIAGSRTVSFDPIEDGIKPETGQTTLDPENENNSALYNPAQAPGTAVGFLSAFGQGGDGDFALGGGTNLTIDTGDTPNEPLEKTFNVLDLNPNDDYLGNPLPGQVVTWESPEYYELELTSFTISSSATLRVIGVNPIMFRVQGITDLAGRIDVAGSAGGKAGGGIAAGGESGAGGFAGGQSKLASTSCTSTFTQCTAFSTFLSSCNVGNFPNSLNGTGPGRGYAGGEAYTYDYSDDRNGSITGTGGGGGGHAVRGTNGEDRRNSGGAAGTPGTACGSISGIVNSGVIGVRSQGGAAYGDRDVIDVSLGGSGGGAGGANYGWGGNAKQQSGAGGGGGGGSIAIISAGAILMNGGGIDASGGDGGKGNIGYYGSGNYYSVAGGGGGGGGGTVALISGGSITISGSSIDASGGAGGARGDNYAGGCDGCNAGGDGGKGFIFMMDADGRMDGFLPSNPGNYDSDPRGVLTISTFNADRFSSITAVTELFSIPAANPAYVGYNPATDMKGVVASGQAIRVLVSSARSSTENPLAPDLGTEGPAIEVARLSFNNGATVVTVTGDMADLNAIPGSPNREAFVRVRAKFDYQNSVEAALGPYASIDRVKISYQFNG